MVVGEGKMKPRRRCGRGQLARVQILPRGPMRSDSFLDFDDATRLFIGLDFLPFAYFLSQLFCLEIAARHNVLVLLFTGPHLIVFVDVFVCPHCDIRARRSNVLVLFLRLVVPPRNPTS